MSDRARADALEICSYRTVFELERRIYRVDRLRLNPQGVPVRGVAYALALIAAGALAERLPGVGLVVRALPWFVRDLAGPLVLAAVAATLRFDGRPFHLAVVGVLRLALGPRHLSSLRPACAPGERWAPSDLVLIPDGSDAGLRRFRFTGPGAVIVAPAHERVVRRRGLIGGLLRRPDIALVGGRAASGPLRAQVIEVAQGARLETGRGRG